jgi:DNA mismatch repair protein MutS
LRVGIIVSGDEARLLNRRERLMASTESERWKPMSFQSILFDSDPGPIDAAAGARPDFFADLHLDQVEEGLAAGREEYGLATFFRRPLHEVEAVHYRHHVLGDLEQDTVLEAVRAFADGMGRMRKHLALMDELHYTRQKQRWFLEAVGVYCTTVSAFAERLCASELRSRGFTGLRDFLTDYVRSAQFTSLRAETQGVQEELAAITYAVQIKGNRVRVSRYEGEPDMSEEIERTFAKFQRGAAEDYRARMREWADMNHVEANILDLVARLQPEQFSRLEQYCSHHERYLDETVGRFDREVQFYLAYLEYIEPLQAKGLAFSQPRVSARSKDVRACDTFDLALAKKLADASSAVVCNDFQLSDPERILVISGPNNGGKTTFARTFGQVHYLASLGLPVPGADVRLFLPDRIFTHFEREEHIETLRGKFEDELFRIREILEHLTNASVLIMNESFGSTTLRDALVVATEVMRQIIELDVLCVFVTFVDELSRLGPSTVSMMSTVVPDDPAVRTYKVVRKRADGLAYAAAIAEKYGLTQDALRRKIAG